MRRVLLIEIDMPAGRWSAQEWEAVLNRRLPDLRPVVFGSIGGRDVDGAWRKLRQFARETEEDASKDNRVHSAMKAQSFFRDMFPDRFWKWFEIGQPQERRQRLLNR